MARKARYRPSLESLETRLVPAVGYRLLDLNGNAMPDLQIMGNARKQIVHIVDDPAANKTLLSIDRNGDGDLDDPGDIKDELLATGFDVIEVKLKGGKDIFEYQAISDFTGTTRELRVSTGSGADQATMNLQSLIGADTNFKSTVWLGAGNDRFTGNLVINSFGVTGTGEFNVHGGAGNDQITMTRSNPPEMETGTVLTPATLNGLLTMNLYGDTGQDRTMIDFGVAGGFDIQSAGRMQLRSDGGTSSDAMLVTFRNTSTSSGTYDLQLLGNKGNDLFSFGVFDESAGGVQFENDAALLDGGKGKDSGLLSPGQDAPVAKLNLEN